MKHAHEWSPDRPGTVKLILGAVLFACVLGLVLDHVLELGA